VLETRIVQAARLLVSASCRRMRGNTKADTAQPPRGSSRQNPAGCPKGSPQRATRRQQWPQSGGCPQALAGLVGWPKRDQSKTVGVGVSTSQVCSHLNHGANTRNQSSNLIHKGFAKVAMPAVPSPISRNLTCVVTRALYYHRPLTKPTNSRGKS